MARGGYPPHRYPKGRNAVEAQQLATKVAQLESRVATLEDEGKIVKGEVKQILTEIRSAILVRDNPFEGADTRPPATAPVEAHVPPVVVVHDAPQPAETRRAREAHAPEPADEPAAPKEPIMLRPQHTIAAVAPPPPAPEAPRWSLLTIAGLSTWAEDAVRRIGPLRLEILLDLCEAAGHLTADARAALSRITELDLPEPAAQPSSNETVVILRQLEALVHDGDSDASRLQLRA